MRVVQTLSRRGSRRLKTVLGLRLKTAWTSHAIAVVPVTVPSLLQASLRPVPLQGMRRHVRLLVRLRPPGTGPILVQPGAAELLESRLCLQDRIRVAGLTWPPGRRMSLTGGLGIRFENPTKSLFQASFCELRLAQ
jgi:hypothetical protein